LKEPVIVFDGVTKTYPYYGYITAGLKMFLFNLPEAINHTKSALPPSERFPSKSTGGSVLGVVGNNGAGKAPS